MGGARPHGGSASPGQGAGMNTLEQARQRAEALLAGTCYFQALGLTELAADARALARLTLELADSLEAERSARQAMQAQRDETRALLSRRHRTAA